MCFQYYGFESSMPLIAGQPAKVFFFTNRQTGVFYPADMFIIISVTLETNNCPTAVEYLINSFCMTCSIILIEIPQILF